MAIAKIIDIRNNEIAKTCLTYCTWLQINNFMYLTPV